MGSCNFKATDTSTTGMITKHHFKFIHIIGKGGFGKVWKVEKKK
jgi:hypothetical protein